MVLRLCVLLVVPVLIAVLCIFGPFTTNPVLLFSGLATHVQPGWLPGFGTADPNMGITSDALGRRAALDVLSGTLPLWDHLEGLGAPLLGSMQPAALFPPTLLLLLPHGQVIEQCFLQFVAGLGTYLFLRSFGLGVVAALAGGVLFELNGTFALLRNAVFNPVAFLPWLLYVVESLRARAGLGWRAQLHFVGVGALAAGMALYAGFPEIVYLYSLLILAWVVVRVVGMRLGPALRLVASLGAVAGLGLVVAAPVLLAFADFLPQAYVGVHVAEGVGQSSLRPSSLLLVLMPWVYGPIAAAPVFAAADSWNGVGGYLGLMPVLMGFAGLYCGRRQAICWLMAGWSVVTIAVSHGAPGLSALFLHVPLVRMTLFFRYLDPGWMLCCVTLSAVFLDRLPGLARQIWVRGVAAGGGLAAVAVAVWLAAPVLGALWGFGSARPFEIGYLVVGGVLLVGFVGTRSRAVLISLAVGEAVVSFVFPLASFEQARGLDKPLIAFLRDHVGLQRMAVGVSAVVNPNYGPALGFASINYDNLPVPARTAEFARAFLDPGLSPGAFWPRANWSRSPDELRRSMQDHVDGYERAAVRYVVGPRDLFSTPAYGLSLSRYVPLPLAVGGAMTLRFRPQGDDVRGLMFLLGNAGGTADGRLRVRLCEGGRCVTAAADLAGARDNGLFQVMFGETLPLVAGEEAEVTVEKEGGEGPVLLWGRPALAPQIGDRPVLTLVASGAPRLVFEGATGSVFELAGARDYADAAGCRVTGETRDLFRVVCAGAARLVRREVWMQGWTARVDGVAVAVEPVDGVFQGVDVPAGASTVSFRYDPVGVRSSLWPALGGVLLAVGLVTRTRLKQDGSG